MVKCNSMEALQAALEKELRKAMLKTQKEVKQAMQEEMHAYYSSGSPVMYKRTYKLSKTPTVSQIFRNGALSMSFKAYLNTGLGGYPSITYHYYDGSTSTSKAPSMTDVLNLTNYGTTSSSVGYLHPASGSGGYWERAENKFQQILDKNISRIVR